MEKEMRVLILGTVCRDKATELRGTLTHWLVDMDGRIIYIFQPKGLDGEGQPLQSLLLGKTRLEVTDDDFETVNVPFEILGTQVTDKASGFTGMATKFIRHINGCFHVYIQPKGLVEKTGLPVRENDFDLRQCEGEKIPILSQEELAESKEDDPSPAGKRISGEMPGNINNSRLSVEHY